MNLQRLRRSTDTISSFIKHHRSLRAVSVSPLPFSHPQTPISSSSSQPPINIHFQYRLFRSTSSSLLSARYNNNYDDEKISPDTILFEGCDYNHWLITMDFPKDESRPTPEQMVETYVQTCAKGLNISVEEAKQKIYACSTTTYNGFQAVMTEEESKKFEGLPGVVFILPDSYIDPVNKEYGGDKYINGTIIPRPPPVQYGRQDRGRFNDQNRNPGRQRYDRGNPDQRVGDGRSYGGPQNYGERRDANMPPMNNNRYGESRDANMPPMNNNRAVDGGYQGERGVPMPSYQQQRGVPMPPMNNNRAVDGGYQGEGGVPMPSYQQQGNYNHQGNYPQERRDIPMPGNFRGYDKSNTAPLPGGNYGPQGQGSGMLGGGRGEFYGQVPGPQGGAGSLGQGSGMGSGQGQSYPENGEGRRFS